MAVGAGTFITVNANDVAVDLATLLAAIDSTSIVVNSGTLERAALTGAIAASQNSNATLFSGIRDNGVAENDRTNLNFVSSTSATAVVTDDSGSDELEITFQRAALTGAIAASANANATLFSGIRVGGSATTDRTNINFIAGTGITLTPTDDSVNDEIEITIASSSGAAGHIIKDDGSAMTQRAGLNFVSSTSIVVTGTDDAVNNESDVTHVRAALTGDITASQNSNSTSFRSFSANSILANATSGSAVPTELAISTNSIPARIAGDLISWPLSNLAGGALSYASGVISVEPDGAHDIFTDSAGVGFRKDQASCWLFEDWQFNDSNKSILTTPSTIHGSTSNWGCQASVASGSVSRGNNASGRPGALNLNTSSTINSGIELYSGTGASGPGTISSIRADDIYEVEIAAILTSTASIGAYLGVSDGSAFTNCILFRYDTNSGDATIKTITSEAGVATVKDTGVAPGTGDRLYTFRQEAAQTISFYVNDVLETTHISSENIPDTESVGILISLATRTGASKTLSVDYISLHSLELSR